MASLGKNVGENPRHVSWNNEITEFEEGRQNMMGFVISIAEEYYYCTRHSGVSLTKNPASQQFSKQIP